MDNVNNNIDKIKEKIVSNNPLCTINNNKNYYENIYNNWKKIFYPKNLYDKKYSIKLKDKRRQNLRNTCSKYKIIDKKLRYIKNENDLNNKLQIPCEIEKQNLLNDIHIK